MADAINSAGAARKPTAGEVLDSISRLACEAEWTEEEIDEALREEGIDPDELVKGVMRQITRVQKLSHPEKE